MENDENKDLLLEEISEYYSSEATDDDIIAEQPENEPEPKIITANHTDDEEDEQPEDSENTDEYDESDNNADCSGNSKMFFIISAAVALSVLLSVFFAGILSYKDEEDINYRFSHIQTSSKKYSNAQERINLVNDEITALEDEIAEKQAELNTITEYESNTGTIKSKQNSLSAELKELQNTVKNKEKVLSDLENSIKKKMPSIITLTPGLYTVGENLFSGSYNAVGDGSIVVSSANGGAILNTSLTSDAVSFTLEDGNIVKLETKAVFNRIQ